MSLDFPNADIWGVEHKLVNATSFIAGTRCEERFKVPLLHRLNRAEYTNAIHDLLALEFDAESFLPADNAGEGFDNLATVLSVSPSRPGVADLA